MDTNTVNIFKRSLFSAHKDFEEIFHNFPYKMFLTVFGLTYIIYLLLSVFTNALEPSTQFNFMQGAMVGMISAVFSTFFTLIYTFIEIYMVHLFTQMQGGSLSLKDSSKVYIVSLVPMLIMVFLYILGGLFLLAAALLGTTAYSLATIVYLVYILIIISILSVFHYYTLISGIKTMGQVDTNKAAIAGCAPSIILTIISVAIGCALLVIFWGAIVTNLRLN